MAVYENQMIYNIPHSPEYSTNGEIHLIFVHGIKSNWLNQLHRGCKIEGFENPRRFLYLFDNLMWPQPYNWFTFVFCCFSASTFDLIKNTPMSFLSGKAASVKTMISYNQCYDVKMTSSFEWKWRAWSGAQCASVPINMKTSNDSNQPKRKEKVWPDLLSVLCVIPV